MDKDLKGWLTLSFLLALLLAVTICAALTDDAYNAYTIKVLIEQGADPVSVRCARYGSTQTSSFDCNLILKSK